MSIIIPGPAQAVIALDNSGDSGATYTFIAAGTTAMSFSFTVGAGSNRALYLQIGVYSGGAPSFANVTFDGVTMPSLFGPDQVPTINVHNTGWLLVAPHAGAHTITADVTVTDFGEVWMHASSWTGVNQSTPNRTVQNNSATASTTVNVSVGNAVAGDVIIDACASAATSLAQDASQTLIAKAVNFGGDVATYGTSYFAASGAKTMQWTVDNTEWNHSGFALIPA